MEQSLRIKIYCRSFDLKLYRLSKGLYESWGFDCVRLTDQSADGYFYTMLRDTECDIAINVDEDCFITNKNAVLRLVDNMIEQGVANVGCADCGEGMRRKGDARVTNPFFNVFDLRLLRQQFSRNAIREYEQQTPHSKYFEPYYPFFLWMADHYKIDYLEQKQHPDGWTTILYDHSGIEICRHTWLARFYSTPAFIVKHWQSNAGYQQDRINTVIDEAYTLAGIERPIFRYKDYCTFALNKAVRWMIKVPQRIAGWPRKLKAKLQHQQ